MTAALEKIEPRSEAHPDDLPIIVIGAGPVGIRTVQALQRRALASRIIIYGDEPWAPYNRVQLSSLVAGDVTWSERYHDTRAERIGEVQLAEGSAHRRHGR